MGKMRNDTGRETGRRDGVSLVMEREKVVESVKEQSC